MNMGEVLYGVAAAAVFDYMKDDEAAVMGYAFIPKNFFLKKELPKGEAYKQMAGCAYPLHTRNIQPQ